MSTPKNKLSADFDRRGKRASVVQRFITAEQPAEKNEPNEQNLNPSPEQSIEPEKIAETAPEILQIAETTQTTETEEYIEVTKNSGDIKESNENETEELKRKIEFLTSQLDKIKDIEDKINSMADAQSKLENDISNNNVQAEETKETKPPEIETQQLPKYYLRNVMEEAVIAEVTASLKHISDICKCEKCFYDICALVLNSISPNYATSEQGELLGKANTLLNAGIRNKVSGEVFKAVEKVKKQPMHISPVYDDGNSTQNHPAATVQSKSIGKIISQ